MRCPSCRTESLQERLSGDGVLLDICGGCRGIWFDQGELFHLSPRPEALFQALNSFEDQGPSGGRECPRCGQALKARSYRGGQVRMDVCTGCGGSWIDREMLETALSLWREFLSLPSGPGESQPAPGTGSSAASGKRYRAGVRPLPSLWLRTGVTFVLLALLLGVLLDALAGVPQLASTPFLGKALLGLLLSWALSPYLLDMLVSLSHTLRWTRKEGLPDHLVRFVERVCAERKMTAPVFGLIDDGAPQAFTYGHTPSTMRVVISRGLFELLEEAEVEAVVAHELGHGYHWDVLINTMAHLLPELSYVIYASVKSLGRPSGKPEGDGSSTVKSVADLAYLVHLASLYLCLFLSRVRELHADRFSGEVTGNPGTLASALVKIGYGLAARSSRGVQPVGSALGILNTQGGEALVRSTITESGQGEIDRESLLHAMKWELWNPWAWIHELHGTHPLIARRLQYLGEQAVCQGQEPFIFFDLEQPESYWDEFVTDVLVMHLPKLLFLTGLLSCLLGNVRSPVALITWPLIGASIGALYRLHFGHHNRFFPPMNVAALLRKVKVSSIRPVPVTLTGTIIGRGVPGFIFSEDLVLKDQTGILFLDYRQPLWIFEFVFALFSAKGVIGKDVTVEGWFRRAPCPYLEVKTLELGDRKRRCYSYYGSVFFWLALLSASAGLELAALLL